MTWFAVWDSHVLVHSDSDARRLDLSQGTFQAEVSLRAAQNRPVTLWCGRKGGANRLHLWRNAGGRIILEHGAVCFETAEGFMGTGDPLRIHYSWDGNGNMGRLSLENLRSGARSLARFSAQAAGELAELVPNSAPRDVVVDYAGLANHIVADTHVPGLATGSRINTPDGLIAVEALREGMKVDTLRHGPRPIRRITSTTRLTRGPDAKILFRAPYFGLTEDIRVAYGQHILLSGSEVDYLFGADEVLAQAGDLLRRPATQISRARAVARYYHILLDDHDCLLSGRCKLDSSPLGDIAAIEGKKLPGSVHFESARAWPVLDRAGAQAYLSMLSQNRPIAA